MDLQERWPDFLIIGAEKAGTTSLYYYLQQHPQLFFSEEKEPRYFGLKKLNKKFRGPDDPDANLNFATDKTYLNLFKDCSQYQLAGECSTMYLYFPHTDTNIYEVIPYVRLIAILRNPVKRAYSNFMYAFRDGREPLHDFRKALDAEESRIDRGWGTIWWYKKKGLYGEQIGRYLKLFSKEQLLLMRYEDLRDDPISTCQKIFSFLKIDESFIPQTNLKYNISGICRSQLLHKLLNRENLIKKNIKKVLPSQIRTHIKHGLNRINIKRKGKDVPPFTNETKQYLNEYYKNDISILENITSGIFPHGDSLQNKVIFFQKMIRS